MLGLIIDCSTTWGLQHTGNVLSMRIFWSFAAESIHFTTDGQISSTEAKKCVENNLEPDNWIFFIFLNSFERSCQKERI